MLSPQVIILQIARKLQLRDAMVLLRPEEDQYEVRFRVFKDNWGAVKISARIFITCQASDVYDHVVGTLTAARRKCGLEIIERGDLQDTERLVLSLPAPEFHGKRSCAYCRNEYFKSEKQCPSCGATNWR